MNKIILTDQKIISYCNHIHQSIGRQPIFGFFLRNFAMRHSNGSEMRKSIFVCKATCYFFFLFFLFAFTYVCVCLYISVDGESAQVRLLWYIFHSVALNVCSRKSDYIIILISYFRVLTKATTHTHRKKQQNKINDNNPTK